MGKAKSTNINGDYRRGALERLSDAFILMRTDQFAGSASAAGRAVEGMLRAVIWKRDADVGSGRKTLDTGHDSPVLIAHVKYLGLLSASEPQNQELDRDVRRIARLWFNNMRYVSSRFVEWRWYNLKEIRRGRTLKQATEQFYLTCAIVAKRCEVRCQK